MAHCTVYSVYGAKFRKDSTTHSDVDPAAPPQLIVAVGVETSVVGGGVGGTVVAGGRVVGGEVIGDLLADVGLTDEVLSTIEDTAVPASVLGAATITTQGGS